MNDPAPAPANDPVRDQIVGEEQHCLERVLGHLDASLARPVDAAPSDYDRDLLELRDEIATARLEDVPPLIEQMERLQSLAARRRQAASGGAPVDPRSPYFGRLVLEEGRRKREVLIGRSTHLDVDSGVRIVDWRDAPVSRLYYRYEEGDEYDEEFGNRPVEGKVLVRRSLTIVNRELRRINAPQGAFVRARGADWRRLEVDALRLHGGQGTAIRAEQHHRPGRLGVGADDGNEDKHLREITALIDRRQFELITRADSGLVVIQGGAGSGKTTIGLHRLAYLAFLDKRRFRPDRMLVLVFNDALARYVSLVLPALEVTGVAIRTFEDWAARLRHAHLPRLPRRCADETPIEVTRVKKHPAMLRAIEAFVATRVDALTERLVRALTDRGAEAPSEAGQALLAGWQKDPTRPLVHRLHALGAATRDAARTLTVDARVALERIVSEGIRDARDVTAAWSELLTDLPLLTRVFTEHAPALVEAGDLRRAHAWCVERCAAVLTELEAAEEPPAAADAAPAEPLEGAEGADDDGSPEDDRSQGIDGREVEERAALDREDDTLLLRLVQRLRGPLMRGTKAKEALVYEHVLVDEAQDLSPVELAVVLDTVSGARSVTLAGDTAQRLHMDNGFTDWHGVLGDLGLSHVEVEPLKLSYRSTQPIIQLAQSVLGSLAPADAPLATRSGAPVEVFSFAHSGDAVGFLGDALRELMQLEPRASVAVIARYAEQADIYYEGLRNADVPNLRRIAEQDFPFRPGIDVTDVRQVKGLEFDYVVLVEVSDAAYPADDEARHLLHIAITRAAHQLWVITPSRPSPLLPSDLLDRGY